MGQKGPKSPRRLLPHEAMISSPWGGLRPAKRCVMLPFNQIKRDRRFSLYRNSRALLTRRPTLHLQRVVGNISRKRSQEDKALRVIRDGIIAEGYSLSWGVESISGNGSANQSASFFPLSFAVGFTLTSGLISPSILPCCASNSRMFSRTRTRLAGFVEPPKKVVLRLAFQRHRWWREFFLPGTTRLTCMASRTKTSDPDCAEQ